MAKKARKKNDERANRRGYGQDEPQKSIRFTRAQADAIESIRREFPDKAGTFTDGLRAAVCRPSWLPRSRIAELEKVFQA
jgi:hypothetical protein